MELSSIYDEVIDFTHKGFSGNAQGKSLKSLLAQGESLFAGNHFTPIATLKASALKNNVEQMADYCAKAGFELAPHVKTHMSPQLAKMQIDAGATYLTVATLWQARVFLQFGLKSIIIANEVVDFASLREIATLNKNPLNEIICYVDSISGAEIIEKVLLENPSGCLHLLLEIGYPAGRGGIRDLDEVKKIALRLANTPGAIIRGVTGFEGILSGGRTPEGYAEMDNFCQRILSAADLVSEYVHRPEIIISAGGSAFFDVVVRVFSQYKSATHKIRRILRSGGYLSFDHGLYGRVSPQEDSSPKLKPAIEVWGSILTQPEGDFALLNFGKRDVGIDVDNPNPVRVGHNGAINACIPKLNDQHAYLVGKLDPSVSLGDWVACGISHPCTTFDKWRIFPVIDDNDKVVDYIRTYF